MLNFIVSNYPCKKYFWGILSPDYQCPAWSRVSSCPGNGAPLLRLLLIKRNGRNCPQILRGGPGDYVITAIFYASLSHHGQHHQTSLGINSPSEPHPRWTNGPDKTLTTEKERALYLSVEDNSRKV